MGTNGGGGSVLSVESCWCNGRGSGNGDLLRSTIPARYHFVRSDVQFISLVLTNEVFLITFTNYLSSILHFTENIGHTIYITFLCPYQIKSGMEPASKF